MHECRECECEQYQRLTLEVKRANQNTEFFEKWVLDLIQEKQVALNKLKKHGII